MIELVRSLDMPPYRADQVLDWVYRKQVADPARMTDLGRAQRAALDGALRFETGRAVGHAAAPDGVQKLLLDYAEAGVGMAGGAVECVLIPTPPRHTACISSQFGCPVGCRFCASGLDGLRGNLSTGQIVEQAWHLGRLPGSEPVSHVVFMGMGEPLANFDAVCGALRILNAPWGLDISARRITVSTVGLPAQIRRLADAGLAVTLAISLHAPDDDLRRSLIPWAERVTIDDLVEAGRHYFASTGREVTLEYVLLQGINDRPAHARDLAAVARRLRSNVNLIQYNEVPDLPYRRGDDETAHAFQALLRRAGINTHIRASRGRDITAACGQLRRHEGTEEGSGSH